jgi:hypothetical protein
MLVLRNFEARIVALFEALESVRPNLIHMRWNYVISINMRPTMSSLFYPDLSFPFVTSSSLFTNNGKCSRALQFLSGAIAW